MTSLTISICPRCRALQLVTCHPLYLGRSCYCSEAYGSYRTVRTVLALSLKTTESKMLNQSHISSSNGRINKNWGCTGWQILLMNFTKVNSMEGLFCCVCCWFFPLTIYNCFIFCVSPRRKVEKLSFSEQSNASNYLCHLKRISFPANSTSIYRYTACLASQTFWPHTKW